MQATEQNWPDWFSDVIKDADGLLRTFFEIMAPRYQRTIMLILEPEQKAGASHQSLVARFNEKVQKYKDAGIWSE